MVARCSRIIERFFGASESNPCKLAYMVQSGEIEKKMLIGSYGKPKCHERYQRLGTTF